MPLFAFACRDCGAIFETLVARADVDTVTCASCGSAAVQRRLSSFSVGAPSAVANCATRAASGGCEVGGGSFCPTCPAR